MHHTVSMALLFLHCFFVKSGYMNCVLCVSCINGTSPIGNITLVRVSDASISARLSEET